jgi:hypothetical protein
VVVGGEGRAGGRCQRSRRCYRPCAVGRVQLDMTGVSGASAPLSLTDVRDEFPGWQLREGYLCWTAIRRPTPTAVEVIVGQDLDQLVGKLHAEQDQDDHRGI